MSLMRLLPGVNMVKRKLAAHDNLKITIEQTGDKFHVKESSNFRSIEIDFTLGVTFEYSLADGTELSVNKSGTLHYPEAKLGPKQSLGSGVARIIRCQTLSKHP